MALTSVNPLRIYIYEEGLARLATEKYDTQDLKNVYSHLTNYSINKKNKAYTNPHEKQQQSNNTAKATRTKWPLKDFKAFLEKLKLYDTSREAKNLNVDHLFEQIHEIIVKTIISAEPLLWNGIEMMLPNTYSYAGSSSQIDTNKKNNNCFELLGFDILID